MIGEEQLEKRFVETFLSYAIRHQDMFRDRIIGDIPLEKRKAAEGRSAKLWVDGNGGGIFYLWLSNDRIDWLPKNMHNNYRNDLFLQDTTFLYLIIGELTVRDAYRQGLVSLGGDMAPYDAEELMRVLERIVNYIFRPLYERVRGRLIGS